MDKPLLDQPKTPKALPLLGETMVTLSMPMSMSSSSSSSALPPAQEAPDAKPQTGRTEGVELEAVLKGRHVPFATPWEEDKVKKEGSV